MNVRDHDRTDAQFTDLLMEALVAVAPELEDELDGEDETLEAIDAEDALEDPVGLGTLEPLDDSDDLEEEELEESGDELEDPEA